MDIFRRIFFAAVLAGAVAGLALGLVQQWRAVPLILHAETFETAGHSHGETEPATEAADHTHAEGTEAHDHDDTAAAEAEHAEAWAPADGWERTGYTLLATTLAGIGFIFVAAGASVLSGLPITAQNGALWGLAGFITFSLAPAFGLPPELPGMAAADLGARQTWWWGTVLATGLAIFAIAKYRTFPVLVGGLVLIALPHIIGAPLPPEEHSDVPAHLATAFAATTLTASMIYWLLGCTLLGWLITRFNAETKA